MDRRADPKGPRGRADGERARPDRHRRQRRRQAGDPGHRGGLLRGRRGVAGVPARPGRPRPVRRAAGHQRRPRRAGERDRPGAAWQRCRTHYHRNLLTRVPKSAQPWVSTLVRTIFEQPDAGSVRAQHAQVVTALEAKFPAAAAHLDEARDDILAFTAFPREVWRQVWSNNPQERLNKEVRRRTDVVGIFPGRDAIIRLVGAVLAEQNDEWTEARRYMGPEILAACRKGKDTTETNGNGVTAEAISA